MKRVKYPSDTELLLREQQKLVTEELVQKHGHLQSCKLRLSRSDWQPVQEAILADTVHDTRFMSENIYKSKSEQEELKVPKLGKHTNTLLQKDLMNQTSTAVQDIPEADGSSVSDTGLQSFVSSYNIVAVTTLFFCMLIYFGDGSLKLY